MKKIKILNIQRLSGADRAQIEAVDPAVELTDAGGWFDGEIHETWPAYTAQRYLPPGSIGSGTREERDRLLSEAEIILGGFPFPLDLRARAPKLKWFHQRPAGASNLLRGDLWGSAVTVTTSRGMAAPWRWPNTRSPASCTSPRACTAPPSTARPARSTRAPIGHC